MDLSELLVWWAELHCPSLGVPGHLGPSRPLCGCWVGLAAEMRRQGGWLPGCQGAGPTLGPLPVPPPATLQRPWPGLVQAGPLSPPAIPGSCTSACSSCHCVPLSGAYGFSPDTWDVGNRSISGYLVVLRVPAGFVVTPQDSRQQIPQSSLGYVCRPRTGLQASSLQAVHTLHLRWRVSGVPASFRPTAPAAASGLMAGTAHSNADLCFGAGVASELQEPIWVSGLDLGPLSSPSVSTGQQGVPATRHWLACSRTRNPTSHSQAQARPCGRAAVSWGPRPGSLCA